MAITVLVNSPYTNTIKKIGDTINISFTLTNSDNDDVSYKIVVKDADGNFLSGLVNFGHYPSPHTFNHSIILTQEIYDNKIVVEIGDYGEVVIEDFSAGMAYDGILGMHFLYSYDIDYSVKDKIHNIVISDSGN
jgi:hypothetical protein